MRRTRLWLIPLLVCLTTAPALAYTIYLKDGTKIVAKTKYEVDGDRAIITLPSGTRTAYPLAEVDIERTDRENQQDVGTAIIIEGGKAEDLSKAAPPKEKTDLQDLIRSRAAGVQTPPEPQATPRSAAPRAADQRPGRPAAERRAPLTDVQLANELKAYLISRGAAADVYQGSRPRHVLLIFETRSEGTVFKAIAASAYAIEHVRGKFPDKVEAFEILCEVPDAAGLGGRFTMLPEQAADLLAGRSDVQTYFVDNVEF